MDRQLDHNAAWLAFDQIEDHAGQFGAQRIGGAASPVRASDSPSRAIRGASSRSLPGAAKLRQEEAR